MRKHIRSASYLITQSEPSQCLSSEQNLPILSQLGTFSESYKGKVVPTTEENSGLSTKTGDPRPGETQPDSSGLSREAQGPLLVPRSRSSESSGEGEKSALGLFMVARKLLTEIKVHNTRAVILGFLQGPY